MSEHQSDPPDPRILAAFAQPEYRLDGPPKVTGQARYAGDKALPGMLWAAFLSSTVPYGRIVSVDTSRAKAMPGVHAVLTGEDVGGALFGRMLLDRPVICWDVVRFVGDRIAAVAAETLEQAEAAVAAIEVEIEELTPILDPAESLADGAPLLHPEPSGYRYLAGTRPEVPHPNVQGRSSRRRGADDIEAVFAAAAHVFEHEFSTPRHHHGYMEPRATLVWIDEAGIVHVATTNKSPLRIRSQMAATWGIPPEQIDVDAGVIGGDFGGKGYSPDEPVCYFLAKATGRPVKAVTSYADELSLTNLRHAARMRLRTAVDRDGRILAHQARITYDGGAYAAAKPMPFLTPNMGVATLSGYRIPNVDIDTLAVYTNTVPAGHMRAPGEVQAVFAGESHLDMIAGELGIDPIELRLRNAITDAEPTGALGDRFREPKAVAVLERARAELGWENPLPEGHGRGIALSVLHVGVGGPTTLSLQLASDGTVSVLTGFPDQGGGLTTVIRRVLAATASIAEERIRIVKKTGIEAPLDPGVGGSWATHIASRASELAGLELRDWLEERLPRALPDAPAGVELRDDAIVDPATGRPLLGFTELAGLLVSPDAPVELTATYTPTMHPPGEPADVDFAAFGAEVAVDRETGAVTVVDALLVADVGTIINPVGHRGQLEGGFAFGLGAALMEEVPVEHGVVVGRSLAEVKFPTIRDVPWLRVAVVPAAVGPGALGAKAAGELSNMQIAPAIANAVAAAVGARVTDLPITPERVLRALAKGPASAAG